MGRGKPLGEEMDAVEVPFLFLEIIGKVQVVGGSELGQVDVDEIRVCEKIGAELEKLVQLVFGHVSVDCVGAETPAVLGLEVFVYEACEIGKIGPLQAA